MTEAIVTIAACTFALGVIIGYALRRLVTRPRAHRVVETSFGPEFYRRFTSTSSSGWYPPTRRDSNDWGFAEWQDA